MKKLFLLSAMLFGVLFCSEMKADSKIYYAKVTVDVAEDSKGLGTVYLVASNDEHVTEATGQGSQIGSTGATVGFIVGYEPADGYVLMNFTDQNNNVVEFEPYSGDGRTMGTVGVWAESENEEEPTVFNLSAHFVLESELPRGELIEVTVPSSMKFATFFSPVDTEIPDGISVYTLNEISEDAVVLTEENFATIPAFTAVLLENSSMFDATVTATYEPDQLPEELPSFTTGLLTGTLEEITVPAGCYGLIPSTTDGAEFSRAEAEEVPVEAYQCYLTAAETEAQIITLGEKTPATAVSAILGENGEAKIFDLDGNRRAKLEKGVNIVNGVKVIVK